MSNELKRVAARLGNMSEPWACTLSNIIREALAEQDGEKVYFPWRGDIPQTEGFLPAPSADLVERLEKTRRWVNSISHFDPCNSERNAFAKECVDALEYIEQQALALEAKDKEIARLTAPVGDEEVQEAIKRLRTASGYHPQYGRDAALLERLARERDEARKTMEGFAVPPSWYLQAVKDRESAEAHLDTAVKALGDVALERPVGECATFRPDLSEKELLSFIREFAAAALASIKAKT